MGTQARRTHYQRLGVRPDAPIDDIRAAYRTRARALHPDHRAASGAAGDGEAELEMAAVNEAWRVLRDPAERRRYDASLRTAVPASRGPTAPSRGTARQGGPSGFPDASLLFGERVVRGGPWLLLVAVLVAIFVFTAFAGRGGSSGSVDDGQLEVGSCVRVVEGRTVAEVGCDGADGRVEAVRPSTEPCPLGLESYALPSDPGRVCLRRH